VTTINSGGSGKDWCATFCQWHLIFNISLSTTVFNINTTLLDESKSSNIQYFHQSNSGSRINAVLVDLKPRETLLNCE